MDEQFKKALEFSNYRHTFSIQRKTLKEKISRGYIGLYYELYKFDYKYSFGTLPAYNTSFSMRYINTIN
jgi:hypothetical protein